jgi:adenylosuccinate lyase
MAIQLMDSVIFGRIFGNDEVKAIFDEKGVVESWLMFERTLAEVQAELGIIPRESADEIFRKARLDYVSLGKIEKYFQETALVSVALIKALKEVCSAETREYIHYGPTTQDLYDTSLAIRLKKFMLVFIKDLEAIRDLLTAITGKYKNTLMIGRTHGRQAIPITFGFKMAIFAETFNTHLRRAHEIYPRITLGSLSGAVGTFSSFKSMSEVSPFELERHVLEKLGLNVPIIPIQPTIERFCEFLNFLALISVSTEKLAQDFFTLQRDEIAEIKESPGSAKEISSSTMPHKQNPKGCEFIIGLSKLVRSYAHALMESPMKDERDRSAFWVEDIAIPDACIFITAILSTLKRILENLEVYPESMQNNIDLTQGLVMAEKLMMALAKKTGKKESAHESISKLASKAAKNNVSFEKVLLEDEQILKHLSPQEIKEALDPSRYLGMVDELIERLLGSYETDRNAPANFMGKSLVKV